MATTLGVDLASQPENTAVCVIAWGDGAEVTELARGRLGSDAALRDLFSGDHTRIGIDAPFGWPVDFVRAVSAHERFEPWPPAPVASLSHRLTDEVVHRQVGKRPLSVSTDRIAYCALRCARLISGPRDGSGRFVEAYPDAALRRWLPESWAVRPLPSYKGKAAVERRRTIVGDLLAALPSLRLSAEQRELCIASDDCLDALVCALIARAADLGLTDGPSPDQAERARVEGWICVPREGSLAHFD